ncbi:SDR family oxidoreductase [Cellulosimicrobium sp. CUA-896]|uniref:SDR family oxidoreductase n=1 Tax=Cellulosimicrobium sp. CUA-896 TaxID=1517881 RepID=UPI000969A1A8|nr:SDR family oxidoreductase [Cellulosimicrobium sp. CUA-896]OLT46155.1 3-beta hydroxysteroid dehydrogenase [Cellulosimicrobium sp. CUA-896]
MKIAVAGGTGTVGKHVVHAARERGHDVVVLSREHGVDVHGNVGITASIDGADAVIDVLNTTTLSTKVARAFFSTATTNLLAAEAQVDTAHHVVLSIVGIDEIDTSYYAGKIAQERLVRGSDVPHTVARAAQFHEFAEQIASQTTLGPLTVAPRTLSRPVAAREVGAHLVSVAESEPGGRAPDLVGPEDDTLAGMIRRMYAHDRTSRRVLDVRFPGAYGTGLASGALRGGQGPQRVAGTTFDQWLESPDHHG